MADILELIKSRRTIRKYLPDKPVDWDVISKCLDAARHAPSSGNLQNWKFIVVTDPDLRKQIAEACLQQYWIISAPILIVACAEPEKAERYYGVRGERLYSIQNCAMAVENLILEAHSLGVGSAVVAAFDEEAIKRLLKMEDFVRPQAIVTLGYPTEMPAKPPKYPLEVIVFFNVWRNRIRDPARYMREYSILIARGVSAAKSALKSAAQKIADSVKEKLSSPPEEKENSAEKDEKTQE